MEQHLRAFIEVADRGSISAAAEAINMSQPALSKMIKRIEWEYGTPLFVRMNRGVDLTETGSSLYRQAKAAYLLLQDARREIDSSFAGNFSLRIGAGTVWSTTLLPALIPRIRNQYSGIKVNITVGTKDLLFPKLLEGDLDIAISGDDEMEDPSLHKEFFQTVDTVAVSRFDHPLQSGESIALSDLWAHEWVFYTSAGVVGDGNQYINPASATQISPMVSTSSWMTGLALVSSSDMLMAVPGPLLPIAEKLGIRQIPGIKPIYSYDVCIWLRRPIADVPAVKKIVELVKAFSPASGSQPSS